MFKQALGHCLSKWSHKVKHLSLWNSVENVCGNKRLSERLSSPKLGGSGMINACHLCRPGLYLFTHSVIVFMNEAIKWSTFPNESHQRRRAATSAPSRNKNHRAKHLSIQNLYSKKYEIPHKVQHLFKCKSLEKARDDLGTSRNKNHRVKHLSTQNLLEKAFSILNWCFCHYDIKNTSKIHQTYI